MQLSKSISESNSKNSPPVVPGLPVLGSALDLMRDPLAFFVKGYHEYGNVFRARALNRDLVILAGRAANQFMAVKGDASLWSHELFGGFAREMDSEDIFLVAMDGSGHRHLRGEMRDGYARDAYLRHLPAMLELTRSTVQGWRVGQPLEITRELQRLVARQLSLAMANFDPDLYFDDLSLFLRTMLNASVIKTWHPITLKNPLYLRAKARVIAMAREILRQHRENPPGERVPDLIDDLLTATTEDGMPLPEYALVAAALGPMVAGIDTAANTTSFMMYALHKHPQVLERVQTEVDEVFADGVPAPEQLRKMTALHHTALETLRMYPVAPAVPRTAGQAFEYEGYAIARGQEVFVASGVTHYLPEFFPEPYTFEIDRYAPPRSEHRKPGVFVPYGLGAHTCLGAGIAEVQIMLTVAGVLRSARFELDPPGYDLRTRNQPLPRPDARFRLRVVGR